MGSKSSPHLGSGFVVVTHGGHCVNETTEIAGNEATSRVPDTCQIARGTTGNIGQQLCTPPVAHSAAPQVNPATASRYPELPKLMAVVATSVEANRP